MDKDEPAKQAGSRKVIYFNATTHNLCSGAEHFTVGIVLMMADNSLELNFGLWQFDFFLSAYCYIWTIKRVVDLLSAFAV